MISQVDRPVLEQTFFNQSVLVGIVPTPLAQQLNLSSKIQTFILCNPTGNASVFLGDQNVSTTTGIELIVSTSVQLSIKQERQFYEIQDPVLLSAQADLCQTLDPVMIPTIVWNPSNIYLISTVPTTIAVMLFRSVYT